MNTNSNTYTVIYTSIVVVVVAAVLAFVSQKLGPAQAANEKAETISQILTAAGFGEKESWAAQGNAATIGFYRDNISGVEIINPDGLVVDSLDCTAPVIYSTSDLKAQNYKIRDNADAALPVYVFRNGVVVIPVYGAGLWGPVWGYVAFASDLGTIVGAYFDHESETPGLGGKIKDDPPFRAQFKGKSVCFCGDELPFNIVKGGAPADMTNGVDAITGATMTSRGLEKALNTWFNAYRNRMKGECCGGCCNEQED